MTAATVEATLALATALALEHPSAIRLAEQLAEQPDDVRRPAAARAVADRLADLGLLRTLLVERYGSGVPPLARIVAGDQLYADLTILAIA